MIIRKGVQLTLEASPLNSRGYERSEHPRMTCFLFSAPKSQKVLNPSLFLFVSEELCNFAFQ
mgnify:CR=1 FL=1